MLECRRPFPHLAIQNSNGKEKGACSYLRRCVNQHALLNQGKFNQVLSQMEQLVFGLSHFSEPL